MKKLAFLTTIILTANLLFSQINHIDTSFYSEALQETKMVDIYFPPGYDENPDTYYSVIYYLHGWFGDQNEMNGMIGMMESLINNGTIEPVIMVGADNSPGPFEGSMYMNSIIWGNYEDYMINDLTNWVESSFRAYPSRDHRAVLGFSMGGYGTFRFGIVHKDKFRVLAAAASQILNLTEVVLDSTRLHILQQNQPGPPFFYDYDNSGSTTMFMFLVYAAFAPNLNTPQTYINPPIVEFPLDENGDYIDTILMKARNNSIDHLIHQLYPEDSVGIFFGCGSADASIYPCHIAFKDSLELLGLPYEFYDHNGGHMIPGGFKERALIFMDSLLSPPAIPPSTCLPEGITFTTQEEIDNFQVNHPNCTEIEGDVTIDGDDITNLEGLSMVTSIGGNLFIGSYFGNTNAALLSISGLEGLTSIGGGLSVSNNEALISLMGLEGLSSIEGNIRITGNVALTNLIGLGNLTSIVGDLVIGEGDYWTFFGNPSLSNLAGLDNLTFIGGDVTISDNDALTSLDGLESLTSIGGGFRIGGYDFWNDEGYGNDALTSLEGLVNLSSIGGYLDITSNSLLTSLEGLGNLTSIGDLFQIAHSSLTSMDGLVNLNTIGGTLWILNNEALISLMGLEGLSSIGGDIYVNRNNVLTSLMGLENIEAVSIEHLKIGYNDSLSTCHVQSICEYLASPNGSVDIHDNAPGCNSPEEVLNICIEGIEKEESLNGPDLNIYPSPVTSCATLNFDSEEPGPAIVDIYNSTGILVRTRKFTITSIGQSNFVLDFRSLPVGMYLCKVQIGDQVIAKKIIKVK